MDSARWVLRGSKFINKQTLQNKKFLTLKVIQKLTKRALNCKFTFSTTGKIRIKLWLIVWLRVGNSRALLKNNTGREH